MLPRCINSRERVIKQLPPDERPTLRHKRPKGHDVTAGIGSPWTRELDELRATVIRNHGETISAISELRADVVDTKVWRGKVAGALAVISTVLIPVAVLVFGRTF